MNEHDRSIVLVEDSFISESGLGKKFEDEGFKVTKIDRSPDMPDKIASLKPDIIVTDLDLDDVLDPYKTISGLKSDERLKEAEIFVLTEELDVKTEVALRKLKVTSYFMKSADPQFIIDAAVAHFNQVEIEESEKEWESDVNSMDLREQGFDVSEEEASYEDAEYYDEETSYDDSNEFQELLSEFQSGLEKHLEKVEDPSDTHYNLGLSYMEMDLLDKALDEFAKSRKATHLEEKSVSMIGVAQRKLGRYDEAIETFKQGFKIASDNFSKLSFRYELADTLEMQGRLKEAFKMFATVYKADKGFKEVKSRLLSLKSTIEINNKI